MGLGYQKSQRHAARDRGVKDRLKLHAAWMKYYQEHGLARDDASARAMAQVKHGRPCPDEACHDHFMAKVRT